ncbi:MAG: hypothetical protein WKF37_20670 [Bryobacteraceae bacterium]
MPWPVVDLNKALVSSILTGHAGYTTAAGHVGPQYRVDHDVSMLVPEVWCRMKVFETDPEWLIENGYLERLGDFVFEGRNVLASRLGYRITMTFVDRFLGRIFETPDAVFTSELLRPEEQDLATFVSGVNAIVEAQTQVARLYFEDGSIEAACPPLRGLLQIMANAATEDPGLRSQFTRESLLMSDWYRERLQVKQNRDISLWQRHVQATNGDHARAHLMRVSSPQYLEELTGTLGADPFHKQITES